MIMHYNNTMTKATMKGEITTYVLVGWEKSSILFDLALENPQNIGIWS